jgi:hypothetical protein
MLEGPDITDREMVQRRSDSGSPRLSYFLEGDRILRTEPSSGLFQCHRLVFLQSIALRVNPLIPASYRLICQAEAVLSVKRSGLPSQNRRRVCCECWETDSLVPPDC